MDPRPIGKIIVIAIILIVLVFIGLMFFLDVKPVSKSSVPALEQEIKDEQQKMIERAQQLFINKKNAGIDMDSAPCLTNNLAPGWVVDVAHNPRQAIDNYPENQCSDYREGKAEHFIELDTLGNLIKIK